MNPAAPRIRVEADGNVTHLVLNRPEKRNALDGRTVHELAEALDRAAHDPATRVLVIRGEGPDFCAGADLAELQRSTAAGPIENLLDADALGRLFIRMRRHPLPILAAVHGHALAGGAGLASACDIVLASDNATFGYPEINLAFVPAMVMTILRRNVSEKVAFELVARGERIPAEEARRIGLVNRIFPAATFQHDVAAYARDLASRPAGALQLIKRLLYGLDGLSFEEGIGRGAEVNVIARSTAECRERVRRFLEKREAR